VLLNDLGNTWSDVSSLSSLGSLTMGPENKTSTTPPAPPPSPSGSENKCPSDHRDGHLREAPTILEAQKALSDLKEFLQGASDQPQMLCRFVEHQVRGMIDLLSLYSECWSLSYGHWGASSIQASIAIRCLSAYCAQVL
jgi:hypothetical protein